MTRHLLALMFVGLSSCQQPNERVTATDATAMDALNKANRQETKIAALEQKAEDLQVQINGVRDLALSNYKAHESLRKTFNGNVDEENKARAARLTASGYCGKEQVNYPDGSWSMRNKECTTKDLK